MSGGHQPELDAVAYVSGVMSARERRRFERHLLECEACWKEVQLDREGRRLAERTREVAPPDLRERVRAAVAAVSPSDTDRAAVEPAVEPAVLAPPRRRVIVPAFAASIAVVVLAISSVALRSTPEPEPIGAALLTFETASVEGTHQPMPAPDLSDLGLKPTGAERMPLGDMPVEAFAFRAVKGSRLILFMAETPFPPAAEAHMMPDSSWRAERDGMGMLCGPVTGASTSATYLAISDDPVLMRRLAGAIAAGAITLA